jgi:hypothetical protein
VNRRYFREEEPALSTSVEEVTALTVVGPVNPVRRRASPQ